MNFVPNDLQNILFKRCMFGGYNTYQVDDVLEKIVEDMAELIKENSKQKEKLEESQDRVEYYKGIENNLQNSLIIAQQTSDDIVLNAKNKAENIVKEAKLQAQAVIDEANKDVLGAHFEYERVKREVEAYKIKIESIIRSELKLIQGIDTEDDDKDFKAG